MSAATSLGHASAAFQGTVSASLNRVAGAFRGVLPGAWQAGSGAGLSSWHLPASWHAQFSSFPHVELAIAVLAALTAAYSAIQLWRVLQEEARAVRLAAVRREARPEKAQAAGSVLGEDTQARAPWYDRFGGAVASTMLVGPKERVRLVRALTNAGFRSRKYRVATLVAIKVALLLVFGAATWFAVAPLHGFFDRVPLARFLVSLAGVAFGWRLPDMVLDRLAASRRRRIEIALPDALDLLVISAESGLSLEQGIEFVAREMKTAMPEMAEELAITGAELRVLGDRRQALQNFADRIDLQQVRSIVATLSQTLRYGTPLAQSLRVLATEMRAARLLRIEARAARMPVLLTIPLMSCILPSLMIVCLGPAILKVITTFSHLMAAK